MAINARRRPSMRAKRRVRLRFIRQRRRMNRPASVRCRNRPATHRPRHAWPRPSALCAAAMFSGGPPTRDGDDGRRPQEAPVACVEARFVTVVEVGVGEPASGAGCCLGVRVRPSNPGGAIGDGVRPQPVRVCWSCGCHLALRVSGAYFASSEFVLFIADRLAARKAYTRQSRMWSGPAQLSALRARHWVATRNTGLVGADSGSGLQIANITFRLRPCRGIPVDTGGASVNGCLHT